MKRKGKRFLVLLTTASLSLNMLGISVFAAEDSPETDAAFVSEISNDETALSVNRPIPMFGRFPATDRYRHSRWTDSGR